MAVSGLSRFSTATIVLSLQDLGVPGCFMTAVAAVTPANRLVGRARTLRCLPLRADVAQTQARDRLRTPHRLAFDEISPGEVLVIDARGELQAAVAGDNLAARIKAAGGMGLVTDGCIRDLPGIIGLDLPVFAGGVHSATFGNKHVAIDIGEPVACGGVLVMPGDFVVGDSEGVVVVPAHLEQQVIELSGKRDDEEAFGMARVLEGLPLERAYPLDAELRREYESGRKAQAGERE